MARGPGDDQYEAIRGHRLGFALDLNRLTRLRHDRIAFETVGGLAQQDLARLGGFLQGGGGVTRVAGDERLAG